MFDDDPPSGSDTEILRVESLDSVKLRIEEYRRLMRGEDGANLVAAAELLKAAVLAGMPDPEVEYFIQHCTEVVPVGTKGQFANFKKQAKIDSANRRKALSRARGDYHAILIKTSDGRAYISNTYNIGVMLENENTSQGLFSLATSTQRIMIMRRPPWLINREWKDEFNYDGMEMDDNQLTYLIGYIQSLGLHHAKQNDVYSCLNAHANSHS